MNWLDINNHDYSSTHRRLLLKALEATTGPVLEVGIGYHSTPYLHEYCQERGRLLVSCEAYPDWLAKFEHLATEGHKVLRCQKNYADAPVEQYPWGVALIDHGPDEQRHVEAIRAASKAQIVVIHDTEPLHEVAYILKCVWPYYRYRIDDQNGGLAEGWTTALSNFIDVSKL